MEDKPSARQYYSSLRSEVELERFQELIGEEADNQLVYVHDKKKNVVTVYRNSAENAKPFWDVAFLFTFVLSVFMASYLFHNVFLWDSISYDLAAAASLIAALIWYIRRRVSYKSVKLEKLRVIELDSNKAKDHITSMRAFKAACAISVILGFFFLSFFRTYSLTYLRYLAEGGPAATTINGEINGLKFDEKTEKVTGRLQSTQGTSQEFELYLQIDRCPDQIYIYADGKKLDTNSMGYYRDSGGFLEESYFKNTIRANLGYKYINTLEVRAGSLDKVWTFTFNE